MKNYLLLISLFASSPALSAEVIVDMLNNKDGKMNVYSEKVLRVNTGDTVTWKSTNAGHNAVFVPKGVPEGVTPLDGAMSKDVSYTFEKPGVYMVKCNPHLGLGMLMAVVVGNDLTNLDQVKTANYPAKAKVAAEEIFAELSKS
jgi:pseudoazurin